MPEGKEAPIVNPTSQCRQENFLLTLCIQLLGLWGGAICLLVATIRPLLRFGVLLWAIAAFLLFFIFRHFHQYAALPFGFSWPWHTPPLWWEIVRGRAQHFPWEILAALTKGLAIAWVLAVYGKLLMDRLFPEERRDLRWLWGLGLALGAGGMAVFFLGFIGAWRPWLLVTLFVLLALGALGVCLQWAQRASRLPRQKKSRPKWNGKEWIVVAMMAAVYGVGLLYALTPSVQSDALRYHLAAPEQWLKIGHWAYLPYQAFSNFPSTVEMLFLMGLALDGDLLAKFFHFLFFPLSTLALVALLGALSPKTQSPFGGVRLSLWAALAWTANPLALPLAGWAFIDLALLFFLLAMVYFLVRAVQKREKRFWVMAALFGGLLCASKYTGVIHVALGGILLGLFLWLGTPRDIFQRRHRWRAALSTTVLFGLIAAAVAAPWWLKNVAYTGNPVYPMAWSLFEGGQWDAELADFYGAKTREKGIFHGAESSAALFRDTLSLPWLTLHYPSLFESFEIGPFYWCFFPLGLLAFLAGLSRLRRKPELALVLLFLAGVFGFWYFSYQSNRFLMPGWALMVLIVFYSLNRWVSRNPLGRKIATAALLLPLLYGWGDSLRWALWDTGSLRFQRMKNAIRVHSGTLWPAYTLGALSREDYLTDKLTYYPAAHWANTHLDEKSCVLLLGEHRLFHWKVPVLGNDWYDRPRILPFLQVAKNRAELVQALHRAGVTHVFVNLDEWGWPRDPAVLEGEKVPAPGSAWSYNQRHFRLDEIRLLRAFLDSDGLEPVYEIRPGRVFLARLPRI